MRFPRAALLPSLIASLLTIAACSKSTPTATEVAAGDKDISGAGSTFFYPIASKWADTYKKETGIGLNYQSIGSGGGIKQIKAKTVTFGASDKPLSVDELNEAGLIQFPAIIGGVIPVVNLEGVTPGQLVLDGKTLAAIFVGDIKKWDDAAIKALNPDVKLPSADIAIVHRSDGSGTTFLFTDYLSKVDENWKGKVGANSAVEWPAGIGAKGNEGVAGVVKQTAASIGYVEYAYAKQNAMSHVRLTNKAGKVVEPGIASFQAAAANADWAAAPGMNVVLTNAEGEASWPITGAVFVFFHKQPVKPENLTSAIKFFDWAYGKGAAEAIALDYVPMPDAVTALVRQLWKDSLKDAAGQPLYR